MRYIVFSDAHGYNDNMSTAILRNLNIDGGLAGMLYLGDGVGDATEIAERFELPIYAVSGNWDIVIGKRPVYERFEELDGIKIMLMHGHRLADNEAIRLAKDNGARIIFCGHTHERADIRYGKGETAVRMFNPGSISLPRDGGEPSFGLFEVRGGVVSLSHGEIRR